MNLTEEIHEEMLIQALMIHFSKKNIAITVKKVFLKMEFFYLNPFLRFKNHQFLFTLFHAIYGGAKKFNSKLNLLKLIIYLHIFEKSDSSR